MKATVAVVVALAILASAAPVAGLGSPAHEVLLARGATSHAHAASTHQPVVAQHPIVVAPRIMSAQLSFESSDSFVRVPVRRLTHAYLI